jgi:hypothetical protein
MDIGDNNDLEDIIDGSVSKNRIFKCGKYIKSDVPSRVFCVLCGEK